MTNYSNYRKACLEGSRILSFNTSRTQLILQKQSILNNNTSKQAASENYSQVMSLTDFSINKSLSGSFLRTLSPRLGSAQLI